MLCGADLSSSSSSCYRTTQAQLSSVQIASPPPLHTIMQHIRIIVAQLQASSEGAGSGGSGTGWSFVDSPEEVFGAVFRLLDTRWEELSVVERSELQVQSAVTGTVHHPSPTALHTYMNRGCCLPQGMAVVPVHGRMVQPSRLFFRLRQSLAPLMFEVLCLCTAPAKQYLHSQHLTRRAARVVLHVSPSRCHVSLGPSID